MAVVNFGGNQFMNCSVPLAFAGRCFIVEPGTPDPTVSVILEHQGQPIFEVLRNEPRDNPASKVSQTPSGIVAVADRETDRFLYKVRPGSETSVIFGTLRGDEMDVRIGDRQIQVFRSGELVVTLENNLFVGVGAGVMIDQNGEVGVGGPIPATLLQ